MDKTFGDYNGYLKPYLFEIEKLVRQGKHYREIAIVLVSLGLSGRNIHKIESSIAGLYAKRRKPLDIAKLENRVAWARAELEKAEALLKKARDDGY